MWNVSTPKCNTRLDVWETAMRGLFTWRSKRAVHARGFASKQPVFFSAYTQITGVKKWARFLKANTSTFSSSLSVESICVPSSIALSHIPLRVSLALDRSCSRTIKKKTNFPFISFYELHTSSVIFYIPRWSYETNYKLDIIFINPYSPTVNNNPHQWTKTTLVLTA